MKTCKREGCELKASARQLCANHYRGWLFRMKRRGLNVTRSTIAGQLEDVLPATRRQMADRLGVTMRSVLTVVTKLHKEGLIHVVGYLPPVAHTGPWQKVFAWGAGEDVPPDKAAQLTYREQRKAMQRPTAFAALLAPLGI